jgi:hypothetical protein
MKTKFKATIKVLGKTSTFSKSSDTVQGLITLVKNEGMSVSNIVSITPFNVVEEKPRGRAKAKY